MDVTARYMRQVQASMAMTNAPICLFVSYTSETVFLCKKNEEYFDHLINQVLKHL